MTSILQQLEITGLRGDGNLQRVVGFGKGGAWQRGGEGKAGGGNKEIAAVESDHFSSPFLIVGSDCTHAFPFV
ncbi:hypothetical protein NKH16_17305 [Mesorhizobium sp. M1307]|uniref:hypothetical protein n=1 Tax=Mesorhizobium sp. M1307 TaxID=2957079 RepID=UPI0033354837